ncbi:gamma carbonic anhydrase family protein [Gynuella sp.]|uniref:gamma carbonic anhydrase family protein n=1 Tax=Gynuella sp. TaxID=2969146 RepID=UPI003D0B1DE7
MAILCYKSHTPKIADSTYVSDQACIIGDVSIGEDSSVWPMAVIRGDMHRITIGARTSVQDGAVLHITHASHYNPDGYPLTIGDDVTIGHNACLHGCTIHNEVLIGIGSTILDGAIIPERVVIGAGSLVAPGKQLDSGYLYMGAPAQKKRPLTDQELNFFKYSSQNYVDLKNEYLSDAE